MSWSIVGWKLQTLPCQSWRLQLQYKSELCVFSKNRLFNKSVGATTAVASDQVGYTDQV